MKKNIAKISLVVIMFIMLIVTHPRSTKAALINCSSAKNMSLADCQANNAKVAASLKAYDDSLVSTSQPTPPTDSVNNPAPVANDPTPTSLPVIPDGCYATYLYSATTGLPCPSATSGMIMVPATINGYSTLVLLNYLAQLKAQENDTLELLNYVAQLKAADKTTQ